MCTIQFQGVCFFRRHADRVEVFLPVSRGLVHKDDKPAVPHHSRLFVELVPGLTAEGNLSVCSHSDVINGAHYHVQGLSVDLSPAAGHKLEISVSAQIGPLDSAELGDLISFGDFTRGNAQHPVIPGMVAAELVATGGTFSVEHHVPGGGREWRISKRLIDPSLPDATYESLPWNVRWQPDPSHTEAVTITVRPPNGTAVATIKIPAGTNPSIIVGNLDDPDPATWPLRRLKPDQACEDDSGGHSNAGPCHDNDFKWLYGMLQGSDAGRGNETLPTPYVTRGSNWRGYDTPTCFPGTD